MSLFNELKRRNVFRVVAAYVVMSWLLLQVADVVLPAFNVPEWTFRFLILGLAIGFVPAVVFSWVFEMTPEGIKKESEVDRSNSITPTTGRKLDYVTIGMLVLVAGLFVADRLVPPSSDQSENALQPDNAASGSVSGSAKLEGADTGSTEEARRSIAVLPFENLSTDSGTDSFANGLHDDLLTHLSRLNVLKVISRTSVLEYRGTTKNMRTIGQELDVSHLIEGGIQRAGDRVRINVQLIDATTDEHLWADTYDRALTLENIFDIQSEIAAHITQALKLNLGADSSSAIERPTENLAAYEAYLRGRLEMEETDISLESYDLAERHLEEAIRLDPGFALAYAQLSAVADQRFWFRGRDPEDLELSRQYAEKSLELDPDLPEGHHAMAGYYYHGFLEYDQALRSLSRAEEALSGDAWYLETKAAVHRRSGDHETGLKLFEMALTQSPRSHLIHLDLMGSYWGLNRYDDMSAMLDRLEVLDVAAFKLAGRRGWIEWSRSGDPTTLAHFVDKFGAVVADPVWVDLELILSALWSTGRQEAIGPYLDVMEPLNSGESYVFSILRARFDVSEDKDELKSALEQDLDRLQARIGDGYVAPDLRARIAEILIYLDRKDEAETILLSLMEDPLVIRDHLAGPTVVARLAFLFSLLGDNDRAIDALQSAQEANSGLCLRAMMQYPGMEALEQHPRFANLVETYGWVNEDKSQGLGL